jgi:hypothetical protein
MYLFRVQQQPAPFQLEQTEQIPAVEAIRVMKVFSSFLVYGFTNY